ncbi:MAG: IPT/TIG domain-containing protein [Herpetosiphonaceae bacterium]|nr:IPT/TIG domain-containing protein [Herpetosiphonaceae bacterium]
MKRSARFTRLAFVVTYLAALLSLMPQPTVQSQSIISASPSASVPAADPAPPEFLRNLPALSGLLSVGDSWTIGGGYLYWAACPPVDSGGGYLRRWPLRGGRAITIVNSRFCTNARSWAADDSGLYYGDGTSILRRPAGNPFAVETIAASTMPTSRIILNNGTTIWRDYIFWLANDTLYSAHKVNHNQLAAPEPLGANAHSLLFANNNHFYWFADGVLYRALKACLGFGGGACSKDVVVAQNGDNVTDVAMSDFSAGSTTFPLWTIGTAIRGIVCRFGNTGQVCSPGTSYTSELNNTVGSLATDGQYLFWMENRQTCIPGQFCFWSDNGRLMKWSLRYSSFGTDPFKTPQQIACKQCYANYFISGSPGALAVADGWIYFDTSNGLSRLRTDAPPITANLAADSMEVTQGIQNLNNDVPLVADKPTYVRVYGRKLSGPNTYSVAAVLYGTYPNGAPLPGSPLRPINGGQDVLTNNGTPNRAATPGSWLFQLPESWVGLDTIRLRPLIDPEQVWSDPDQGNNTFAARSFSFSRRAPICIVTVPVRTHAPPASKNDPSLYRMAAITRQLLPTSDVWLYHQDNDVAQLEARIGIPPWKYEPYAIPEKSDAILRALWLRDALSDDPDRCDDVNAQTHYVGLVHAATNTQDNLGKGARPGSQLYIKLIDAATLNATPQFWQVQDFNTLAHELAHNYGRMHVNCGPPAPANPDPDYPYVDAMGTNCVLDDGRRGGAPIPAHERYYGFDTQSLTPIDPGTTRDYMSYSTPFWVSDYTWRGLFNRINTPPRLAAPAGAGDTVYVSGSVDPLANTGTLDYAWVYPAAAISQGMQKKLQRSAAPAAGSALTRGAGTYTLRLYDAADTLLDERIVTLQDSADGESTEQSFALTLPAPAVPVARLELISDATAIATLQPGGDAPTISLISPAGGEVIGDQMTLSWSAADGNASDNLLFTVQYSPDNGQSWRTLLTGVPNLAGGDTATLDLTSLSSLPGSTAGALIRVAASDGYNTTLATSQPFTVESRAPAPQIEAPGPGPIPAGQPVIVSGSAMDVQDGSLSGAALSWTLDGAPIGSGAQQVLTGLAPGSYTLALTASNSSGQSATATTTVTIAPLAIPQGAAIALDGTCDDAAYSTAPQLPLAPYPDGSQGFVRLVRSGDALYACFVGLKRTSGTSPGTLAAMRVDTDYSRDTQPQPGDYVFTMGEDGVIKTYVGTGGSYASPGPSGVAGQVSANATTWMAELRIEAGVLGGWNHVIGLDVEQAWVSAAGEDYFWPHRATWDNPSTWGAASLGAIPQLNDLTPASVAVGANDTVITLTGTGFEVDSTVQFGDLALATTVVSPTLLEATIPAANLAIAGTVNVTVVNPGLAAAPSAIRLFSIMNPQPQITQAVLVGSVLSITGNSFVAGATVQFNGSDYPASGSDTEISVTLSASDLLSAADAPITVFNPAPGGGVSNVVTLGAGPVILDGKVYLPLVSRP